MPLGMEVGLGEGDFVLDGYGDPAPNPKGGTNPTKSSAMSVLAKRLGGLRWHLVGR